MCVVIDERETVRVELDNNRAELSKSIDRAEVVLRCLKKWILEPKKEEDGSNHNQQNTKGTP